MAAVQSLGLHEPSALSYLVSEGFLPQNPPTSSYKWHYQGTLEKSSYITDEVLQTDRCVVWSRHGTIKRVFNLDIEEETVICAFTTCFGVRHTQHDTPSIDASSSIRLDERALVVILKTQAHIFLFSGDTHVIPLSFDVQKAIPAAYGFILQREINKTQASTGLGTNDETTSRDLPLPTAPVHISEGSHQSMLPSNIRSSVGRRQSSQLPRTFALPELLSELSLVVSGSSRKREPLETCSILSSDEEITYISTHDELHEIHMPSSEPVHLAVTTNPKANTLTVWQMSFAHVDSDGASRSQKNEKTNVNSKRKSSNVYGRQTGAATPTVRGPSTFRDSVSGLSQSIPEGIALPPGRDLPQNQAGDLAAQLGHEFEHVGVQTRSARRVSSMLARTDLGAANDRSAFNEMALGSVGRKSFGRSLRRGESLGGFSDRQSFGTRRRSSFQAASSVYSDGTSFLDIPASHLIDEDTIPPSIDLLGESADLEPSSKLPRGILFMKLKSLPYDSSTKDYEEDKNEHEPLLKVVTMLAPDRSTADERRSRIISVCIMNRKKQEMTIINVAAKTALPTSRHTTDKVAYDLKAVEVQRGQAIFDACSVVEGSTKRLLILTQTRERRSVLHLEAPWSVSYRVNMPTQFKIFGVSNSARDNSPASRREVGIRRIIPDSEIEIKDLGVCQSRDQVLLLDTEHRHHRLKFQLLPTESLPRKIFQMCNFVLPPEFSDSLLVAWWEVKRWIDAQGPETNLEWTAMTVTLFMLAVPFISSLQSRSAQGSRRKKDAVLRSSSGTTIDLSQWEHMQEVDSNHHSQQWRATPIWAWTTAVPRQKFEPKSPSKHSRTISTETGDNSRPDAFLIKCTNLAREFLQSPAGESATGPEGYLPVAVNKDRAYRRTALASILVGLHLIREESKLHEISSTTPRATSDNLSVVIAQIASWLKWRAWCAEPGQFYYTEIRNPARWLMETSVIDTLEVPAQPFEPPSIFQHVEMSILTEKSAYFPSLLDLVSQTKAITPNHPLWKEAMRITPRLFAVTAFSAQLNRRRKPSSVIKHMLRNGIDVQVLTTIPAGLAAICHQAIVTARGQPLSDWSEEFRTLLGRAESDTGSNHKSVTSNLNHMSRIHDAVRDYRAISNNAIDTDSVSRWDAFSEFDRQAMTRLIFHEDRRFQEASKLVNQTRPPLVECVPEPGWSEADLLEAQKELAVHVTRRTLSVAAGRAMMHFSARVPLLTERVPIPAFSLQCVIKPRGDSDNSQPMTLSADKALFTEDKVCWAFFHNGVSAGLMISKDTQWIDTSWILYNKPPELTNRHAGFLLALGLNGHLKSLAKWVAFKYLTPKHTMTSVGLLLGLAASYLGTMDTLVARLLSVHVTRLLPIGAAELNLSPLTQTTGIIGVGLLYFNSEHRRMSEIMLSEIENSDSEDRSGDEPILRDEGYRLAAGFSLGLINLGQGKSLHSLHDMSVVERLLSIAIGTKNVNLVHVLDRATAGAVIAIAFIFLKTNDDTIAQKIDIPDTTHQFDYVRPDIFLLRTLARHLIMWDSITPTRDFIRTSLPSVLRKRADLTTTKRLSTDDLAFFNILAGICFAMSLRFAGSHKHDVRDLLISYLDQFLRLAKLPALNYDAKVTLNSVRNCLDVLALSCAAVMAGSGDIVVMRRLRALHGRTDKETPFGSHLAAHMALGVLFLSGGTATFGTNNIAIAALVISLYPLFPVDVLDNKGHLQALRHLWVLAVDNRCLVVKDTETQQIISDIDATIELIDGTSQRLKIPGLLPEFECIRKINVHHESYWPVQIDFETPVKVQSNSTGPPILEARQQSTRDYLKSCGKGVHVTLHRRAAYEKPNSDVFFSELQALDEARGVPSIDRNAGVNEKWRQAHGYGATAENSPGKNPLDWVFELDAFSRLDFAEKALVLDDAGLVSSEGRKILQETVIDAALDFEFGCLGVDQDDDHEGDEDPRASLSTRTVDKDKLWQLRLLFDWADRWEQEVGPDGKDGSTDTMETGSTRWIKQEFIEHLKWRVWKLAEGDN